MGLTVPGSNCVVCVEFLNTKFDVDIDDIEGGKIKATITLDGNTTVVDFDFDINNEVAAVTINGVSVPPALLQFLF